MSERDWNYQVVPTSVHPTVNKLNVPVVSPAFSTDGTTAVWTMFRRKACVIVNVYTHTCRFVRVFHVFLLQREWENVRERDRASSGFWAMCPRKIFTFRMDGGGVPKSEQSTFTLAGGLTWNTAFPYYGTPHPNLKMKCVKFRIWNKTP